MIDQLLILAQENGDAAAGLGGLCCVAFFGLLAVGSVVLWLWALIDVIGNPRLDANERLIWILVILLVPNIGAVLYLFMGRK